MWMPQRAPGRENLTHLQGARLSGAYLFQGSDGGEGSGLRWVDIRVENEGKEKELQLKS